VGAARRDGAEAAGLTASASAGPHPFRAPHVVALGIAAALPAAVGGVLAMMGEAILVAALAKTAAALVLLALVVALNTLLRQEGLGGEGLTGAAGVLGATLVVLSGASATLEALSPGGTPPADLGMMLLQPLGRGGWLLLAVWMGRCGWALRRLLAPSGVVGWGSVASAAAVACVALTELVQHLHGGAALSAGSGALLPLALWSAGVAAVSAFGRVVTLEPPPE
jgi:hypothetical protein